MEKEHNIWNFYAPVYDLFMRQNRGAYEKLYKRIRDVIGGKRVLEAATGTGLIAKHVADAAREMIATDLAENMLTMAQKGEIPAHLTFQRADATALPFADGDFDVVIISNALHIIPQPEKALSEIRRVMKPDGTLIAPNFIHEKGGLSSRLLSKLLTAAGVVFETKWDAASYAAFLTENGWRVREQTVLKAAIPLMYAECEKTLSGSF